MPSAGCAHDFRCLRLGRRRRRHRDSRTTRDRGLYDPKGGVVIRQAGQYGPDDDHWVYFHPRYAVDVAKAILEKAGRDDLEIVKVSEITVVGREGNVMTVPAGELEKIDAISRDMRAEERRRRTDPKAAERKRRQRERQRQRDSVTAVTQRDRDTVTAPLIPEFDLQNGGPTKALAN
jgi:hypothetical protein